MRQFPIFCNLAGQPVLLLGSGEAAGAKRRLYERAGARIVTDENAEARLAVVAIEDESEATEAAARLKARGLLVNVVDRPELCDFTTPAIVDREPVLIAIGTGGAAAGLAKHVRLGLEALLPERLGALAEKLGRARAKIRERWPATADRRRAIDAALQRGGPLDPFAEGAADRVEAWLAADSDEVNSGVVTIRLRSHDPEDLTLREARLLGQADRVVYDPGVGPAILARARADAVLAEGDDMSEGDGQGLTLILTAPPA